MSYIERRTVVAAQMEEAENANTDATPVEASQSKRVATRILKGSEPTASLTQYSQIGKSFLPTTDTVKTLPTGVYRISTTPQGQIVFTAQKLYTDKILRLPDSKSDEVIQEIEQFWGLKKRYQDFGLNFKRGFLLHGPPGSGKTCTVALIVEQMVNLGGIVILGEHPIIVGAGLSGLREIEPDRPIVVVLEDVDSVIDHHGEANLLSLLDGEMQVDNVVFIATTNYPEMLDQRVVNRPSRFDQIVKIDVPNDEARRTYIESRLDGKHTVTDKSGQEHDLVALSKGFSIAHIRELIIATQVLGYDVHKTVERLTKMKITPKSSDGKGSMGIQGDEGEF